jgi:hypothetical protein
MSKRGTPPGSDRANVRLIPQVSRQPFSQRIDVGARLLAWLGSHRAIVVLVAGLIVLAVSSSMLVALNYVLLQRPMADVIRGDPRSAGVDVAVSYGKYIDASILVYDLRSVDRTASVADVFRVLLQFAERMRERRFDWVELRFRGTMKFKLRGDFFRWLGREYGRENPVYLVRTFPEHVLDVDGSPAYPRRTGEMLAVTTKQIDDFNDFCTRWYLRELGLPPRPSFGESRAS